MSVVSKGKKVANLGLQWFRDIYRNRKLILDLANNNFHHRKYTDFKYHFFY